MVDKTVKLNPKDLNKMSDGALRNQPYLIWGILYMLPWNFAEGSNFQPQNLGYFLLKMTVIETKFVSTLYAWE